MGLHCRFAADLVSARRGWFPLRRRLQNPTPAWQYIVARVQEEFPETIFLLEGLGGSWEATEILLTEGGMHWAYSELFQNYSGHDVAWYLDYANRQNGRVATTSTIPKRTTTIASPKKAARGRCCATGLRAHQPERRLRFHLRRRMARDRKSASTATPD